MEDLQKSIEQNEEIEIDLGRLLRQLRKKLSFIIAVTVIAIIISLLVTKFLIPKKYESMARIYLKPNITESGTIDYNTLTANSKMVNNYVLMLQGNSLLEDVTEKLKLEDETLVKKSLSVSNEADSEIITVSARTEDAKMSKDIVNMTVNLFFVSMKDKLDIKNMTILDAPQVNETPVSPSLKMNLLILGRCLESWYPVALSRYSFCWISGCIRRKMRNLIWRYRYWQRFRFWRIRI